MSYVYLSPFFSGICDLFNSVFYVHQYENLNRLLRWFAVTLRFFLYIWNDLFCFIFFFLFALFSSEICTPHSQWSSSPAKEKERKKNIGKKSLHSRHLSLINNVFLVRHFCFVFSRKILVPFPAGQICCNLRQWIEAFRETFQFRSKESFKKIGSFNILCRRKEKDGLFGFLFSSKIIWEKKQIRTHLGGGRELNLILKKKVEVQEKKE